MAVNSSAVAMWEFPGDPAAPSRARKAGIGASLLGLALPLPRAVKGALLGNAAWLWGTKKPGPTRDALDAAERGSQFTIQGIFHTNRKLFELNAEPPDLERMAQLSPEEQVVYIQGWVK